MVKNIIITGASSGIGFELAKIFLQNGHNVLAIARREENLLKLQIYATQSQLKYLSTDLREINLIKNILPLIEEWNQIDLLYNNAGLLIKKDFSNLTEQDFMDSYKLNFLAPVKLIQLILSKLNQNSHIVNITSMGAVQGSVKFPQLVAYSTSKAALSNLTEMLAEEFKDKNITVNAIALGAVQTDMLKTAFPDFKAPIQPSETAQFLFDFGLNYKNILNGKIIQASTATP